MEKPKNEVIEPKSQIVTAVKGINKLRNNKEEPTFLKLTKIGHKIHYAEKELDKLKNRENIDLSLKLQKHLTELFNNIEKNKELGYLQSVNEIKRDFFIDLEKELQKNFSYKDNVLKRRDYRRGLETAVDIAIDLRKNGHEVYMNPVLDANYKIDFISFKKVNGQLEIRLIEVKTGEKDERTKEQVLGFHIQSLSEKKTVLTQEAKIKDAREIKLIDKFFKEGKSNTKCFLDLLVGATKELDEENKVVKIMEEFKDIDKTVGVDGLRDVMCEYVYEIDEASYFSSFLIKPFTNIPKEDPNYSDEERKNNEEMKEKYTDILNTLFQIIKKEKVSPKQKTMNMLVADARFFSCFYHGGIREETELVYKEERGEWSYKKDYK